jgi:hypothetical protein
MWRCFSVIWLPGPWDGRGHWFLVYGGLCSTCLSPPNLEALTFACMHVFSSLFLVCNEVAIVQESLWVKSKFSLWMMPPLFFCWLGYKNQNIDLTGRGVCILSADLTYSHRSIIISCLWRSLRWKELALKYPELSHQSSRMYFYTSVFYEVAFQKYSSICLFGFRI